MKIKTLVQALLPASFLQVSEGLTPEAMTALTADVEALNAQLDEARTQLQDAQANLQSLQATLEQRTTELDAATAQATDLQTQLDTATSQNATLQGLIDNFKKDTSALPNADATTLEAQKPLDAVANSVLDTFEHLPK
jgi:chromosome segregation ATPase